MGVKAIVQSESLKTSAYDWLRSRILTGEMKPGAFLSERRLALEMGMSKTPVHAALERLEVEGLITVSPQLGVLVREFSLDDLVNHFEVREGLEPLVVHRVAGHLDRAQIKLLKANLAELQRTVKKHDLVGLVTLDTEFHLMLCEFHGNGEITSMMQRVRDKAHQVILRLARKHPERPEGVHKEHTAIAKAIIAGDGRLAAKLMTQHLQWGIRHILPASVRPT